MEKSVRPYLVPSSTTLQRIFIWGVPSLTLLGLVGGAGLRWFYQRETITPPATSPAAPCCTCDSTPLSSSPTDQERSRDSMDSGVDEGRSSSSRESVGRKNSEDEKVVTPFKINSTHRGKQMTSSNLQLPPLEVETPLTDLAPTSSHIPPIDRGSFSAESTSSSEGEGIISLHKSPVDYSATALAENQGESTSITSTSNDSTDAFSQLKMAAENSIAVAAEKESSSPSLAYRKDHARVMLHIPRSVVGRFIGKQGRNIKALMVDSNGAHVYVNQKNLPKDAQIVLCTVQGTSTQISGALTIIRAKYPEIDVPVYPPISTLFDHTSPLPSPNFGTPQQNGESWEVELLPAFIPRGSFSAMVCYIESLTEVWLVACEKSVELDEQHQSMSYTYCYTTSTGNDHILAKESDKDLLGKFCAVRVSEIHWLRGRVAKFGDDSSNYEVQLMDYGSVVVVPPSAIKPLRREHCRIPVQAFRARIAHIECKDDCSETCLVSLQRMVEGVALEVHITHTLPFPSDAAGGNGDTTLTSSLSAADSAVASLSLYTTVSSELEGAATEQLKNMKLSPLAPYIPAVELYTQLGAQTPTFINRELVELGFASWKEETAKEIKAAKEIKLS